MSNNTKINITNIPSEAEVLEEIAEYYHQRSGPRLDTERTIKGLERFYEDVLHGRAWEEPCISVEDIKALGLNSESGITEN